MAPASFTHLHTHTEFSMLDGAARVKDLVAAAAADGQPALGITDHGNMYGVLDFYKACKAKEITPIIGTEAYMAGESRHERPVRRGRVDDTGGDVDGGQKLYYHLTLLAETTEGYRNLLKLSSAAYLEGYYYKPRVDWELLERHHEGIVATTGCLGGVVLQALLAGQPDEAKRLAARLQDIFGRDGLFVAGRDLGGRRARVALVARALAGGPVPAERLAADGALAGATMAWVAGSRAGVSTEGMSVAFSCSKMEGEKLAPLTAAVFATSRNGRTRVAPLPPTACP